MRALATALLGLALPVSLHAQFFGPIEDLFQRVDGLALYGVAGALTGFEAEESTLDLRGSSRGLPILAAYATAPVSWNGLQPYLGLNTGFLQLWNAQGYDFQGRQYGLSAETFQIGASAGLYHDSPRSLDLTAVLVGVGYQFGRLTEGG